MTTTDRMAEDPARDDMLILVDALDRQVGVATKRQAHVEHLLHRAFSVVLTRERDGRTELLLTRRAAGKYHSAGLWANSCCSHPRAGEEVLDAARRRVGEELGCGAADLREIGAFAYRAVFEDGLCEFEYDHVLVGRCLGEPSPDPAETSEARWVGLDRLAAELADSPEVFAAWAPMVLSSAMAYLSACGSAQ